MIKRILLFLTLLALLLTCSCSGGTQATASDTSAPSAASGEEKTAFTPPEHYATVLTVNINPSFTLFLADDNTVIAVKPNNDDARHMIGHVDYLNRGINDVIDDIVQVAVDDGYLKAGGKVSVDVSFTVKSEDELQQIAQQISERVVNRSKDAGIAFEAETTVAEDAFSSELPAPGSAAPEPASQGQSGSGGSGEGCSVCQGSGRCGFCGAKGTITCEVCHGAGSLTCHRCEGTGKMKCHCSNGVCPRCNGTLKMPCDRCNNNDPNCPECHGTGKVDCRGCVEDPGRCYQCKGTGYAGIDDQCGGTGKEKCGPCQGTGITDCNQCHGNGKCPACNGTGRKS